MKKIIIFFFLPVLASCSSFSRYHKINEYKLQISKGESKQSVISKLGKPVSFSTSDKATGAVWVGCNTTFFHYLPIIGFPLLTIINPINCNSLGITFDENDKVNSIAVSDGTGTW